MHALRKREIAILLAITSAANRFEVVYVCVQWGRHDIPHSRIQNGQSS